MDKNSKRKVAGGAVYVFCAFMLVSILTVAMLTAIGNRKNKNETTAVSDPPVTDTATAPVNGKADDGDAREKGWERTPTTTAASDSDHNIVNGTEPANSASAVPYAYSAPVSGSVCKKFSDELAVWSATMNDYRAHMGVDVEAAEGTEVKSIADGVVSAVYTDEFMGDCLCIEHSGGMKSFYMNLSGEYPDWLATGAEVACGQTIAAVGHSAKAEAYDPPHLHFEVTVNGEHIDPASLVELASAEISYEDE